MTENDFLQLVRRWQDPGTWVTVEALAANAADFEAMADKLGADARFILDRGDATQARTLKAESDHVRNCAADVLRQRAEMAGQVMQVENWVREHRPELLEFVPSAQFGGDPSAAIRDLKRLESAIRKPAAAAGIESDGEPLLQVSDPEAKQFMHRGQWATAGLALERFDIKGPQLSKAATRANGLYKIKIERRKNSAGLYVYHLGCLQLLKDAITDGEE